MEAERAPGALNQEDRAELLACLLYCHRAIAL